MTFNEFIDGMVKMITVITPIALAYLTFRQVKANKRISKQLDGITTDRIAIAKAKAEAETKLQVIAVINPELKEVVDLPPTKVDESKATEADKSKAIDTAIKKENGDGDKPKVL